LTGPDKKQEPAKVRTFPIDKIVAKGVGSPSNNNDILKIDPIYETISMMI